jgi:hypothetical protein
MARGSAPLPHKPTDEQEYLDVPSRPTAKYPEYTSVDGDIFRDMLGDSWGSIYDSHNAMAGVVGKRLTTRSYDSMSRTLCGAITGISLEMLPILVPEGMQNAFWGLFGNYAWNAATWAVSPGMREDCVKVAEYCGTQFQLEYGEEEVAPLEAIPPGINKAPEIDPITAYLEREAQKAYDEIHKPASGEALGTSSVLHVAEDQKPDIGKAGLEVPVQPTTSQTQRTAEGDIIDELITGGSQLEIHGATFHA